MACNFHEPGMSALAGNKTLHLNPSLMNLNELMSAESQES